MKIHRVSLAPLILAAAVLLSAAAVTSAAAASAAVTITDTRGRQMTFSSPPKRVVSLVPGITDTICALGADQALVGVTFHGARPRQKNHLPIVGGFAFPDVDKVTDLDPDVVFVSRFQKDAVARLEGLGCKTVCLDTTDFDQGLNTIAVLAAIFDRQAAGRQILDGIHADLSLVRSKLDKLDLSQPRRVFRLMGRDTIMTPAAGAFLNQLVICAGGVPMAPPGDGMVTPVSLEQWQQFNPEIIFGCGEDRQAADRFFHRPGWREVDAVQNGQVHYFPCGLTCRVGPHTGYFVQWLAATIYGGQFFTPGNQVRSDQLLDSKPLPIDLNSIQNSHIHTSRIADFTHKTLVIDFKTPQTVLSTLEGFRSGITTAANHYLPPPAWQMAHAMTPEAMTHRILDVIEKKPSSSALLMTGADMDHVTVTTKSFKEMTVFAAVTAGVGSNAQRAGKSTGSYYEPGTINIILMTNMALSPRAMTRSLIAATEAKTAALADLDIRSSDDPAVWQATGTGTDNILVVQGTGPKIDGAGGHTKMGELIARAVHEGVTRAVFLQNGLTPGRSVFQRLAERRISLHTLTDGVDCQCRVNPGTTLTGALQSLLMTPRYAGMVEQAMVLADAQEKRQIADTTAFSAMTRAMAEEIAGRPVAAVSSHDTTRHLPGPLRQVFDAMLTGMAQRYAVSSGDAAAGPNKAARMDISGTADAPEVPDAGEPADQPAAVSSIPGTAPRRIISLGPVLTKTLYALGAGNRLIANTTFCETPPGSPPVEKIGTLLQVNVEKILSLNPDLVLASQFTKPGRIKAVKGFGIPVVQFQNPVSFEEINANTKKIGRLIHASEKAEQIVARAAEQVAAIQSSITHSPPRKVFIQIGIKPLHTANADTFVHEFIRLAGGVNIAANASGGVYSREKVVEQDPDVILISTMGTSKSAGIKEKQQWMAFSTMTAVKDQAVHLLDAELICSPTPLIFARGLREVATLIHPGRTCPAAGSGS